MYNKINQSDIYSDKPMFQQKVANQEISTKTKLRRKLEDYLRKYATEKQMRTIAKDWGIEL